MVGTWKTGMIHFYFCRLITRLLYPAPYNVANRAPPALQ